MQSAPIVVNGQPRGRIDVVYTEERPALDEGPLLKEERSLTDANPNVLGGEWTWYAVDVPEGTYTLGAAVIDQITAAALTDRLAATVTVSYAGAYVVDDLGDAIALDGNLTLREAIEAASTNAPVGDAHAGRSVGEDIIRFDPTLAGGQINMSAGQLAITDDLCIQGLGSGLLTVAGAGTSRIFRVDEDVQAWIGLDWSGGMTLLGGFTTADGGAIYSEGILSLTDVTFNANTAYDDGGAIASLGTLSGTDLAFTGNSVAGSSFGPSGGGIYVYEDSLTLTDVDVLDSDLTGGGVRGGDSTWMNGAALTVAESGTGRLDITGGLSVGHVGSGTLSITGGGTVSCDHGRIANQAATHGAVTVSGAGSTCTNSMSLIVGYGAVPHGTGRLPVADGGRVEVGGGIDHLARGDRGGQRRHDPRRQNPALQVRGRDRCRNVKMGPGSETIVPTQQCM